MAKQLKHGEEARKALAKGVPLSENPKSTAGKAIENVCLRLMDEHVPLLEGVMNKRKRRLFY